MNTRRLEYQRIYLKSQFEYLWCAKHQGLSKPKISCWEWRWHKIKVFKTVLFFTLQYCFYKIKNSFQLTWTF